jgi:hypothetical protein
MEPHTHVHCTLPFPPPPRYHAALSSFPNIHEGNSWPAFFLAEDIPTVVFVCIDIYMYFLNR